MTKEYSETERVARAIHRKRQELGFGGQALWEYEPEYIKSLHRATAQAAIAALPPEQEVSEEDATNVLVQHFMAEILRSFPKATAVPSYWHHEEKAKPILAALRSAGYRIVKEGT